MISRTSKRAVRTALVLTARKALYVERLTTCMLNMGRASIRIVHSHPVLLTLRKISILNSLMAPCNNHCTGKMCSFALSQLPHAPKYRPSRFSKAVYAIYNSQLCRYCLSGYVVFSWDIDIYRAVKFWPICITCNSSRIVRIYDNRQVLALKTLCELELVMLFFSILFIKYNTKYDSPLGPTLHISHYRIETKNFLV